MNRRNLSKTLIGAVAISFVCVMQAGAQEYSMVVTCKDGTSTIYDDIDLDTVYFCKTKDVRVVQATNAPATRLANLMSFDVDLNHIEEDNNDPANFCTTTVACIPGTTVTLYKYNRHPEDDQIIFNDCNGSKLAVIKSGEGDGGWGYLRVVAPVNTASATLRYYEKYADQANTKAAFSLDKELVYSAVNTLSVTNKTKTIGVHGDSTGQGLQERMSNGMFNDEAVLFKGSVGSENVFCTAARQGSVPLVVEPFTIPATSKARWSNSTGAIQADGTDPEIHVTPQMLYEVTDANGNKINQKYEQVYFTPTYPFYATVAGVKGYIYTIGSYKKNSKGVLVVNNDEKHTYFHRLEDGAKVVKTDTCWTVSNDYEMWQNNYNVNLMGTNGGFLTYDENMVLQDYTVSSVQRARNLFNLQKKMSEYCNGKYMVVGMFCECSAAFDREFYEEYEKLCEEYFGNRFFNARKYLINKAWTELGITLTADDKANINAGLPPYSLFGNGDGVKVNDPHLTNVANRLLANRVAERLYELQWIKSKPTLNTIK